MQLNINGQNRTVAMSDETPLLWVLREGVGLTGTKYGCGRGLCGACTVHIDGRAVRSCLTPAATVVGEVTTIEGLSGAIADALLRAWITESVAQCGYCQPGQIMGAAALLAQHPDPSDAEIDAAMAAHLCRCGTYLRIRKAIHLVAKSLKVSELGDGSSNQHQPTRVPQGRRSQ
jgi:isoquinoline 1-oxidoreductase subunit alpha